MLNLSEALQSLARHGLGFVGGVFVTHGWIDAGDVTEFVTHGNALIGEALAAAAYGWSLLQKYRAKATA